VELFGYLLLPLFALVGPWIFVWRMSRGRKVERAEDLARWRELSNRVLTLDRTVKDLKIAQQGAQRHLRIRRNRPASSLTLRSRRLLFPVHPSLQYFQQNRHRLLHLLP
jgi:hypothetical protein